FILPTIDTGFTVRYTGSPAKMFVDEFAVTYCNYVSGNNDYTFTSAQAGRTISISATDCGAPAGGGSGGGGGGVTQPWGTLSQPNGGQTLNAGSSYQVLWSAGGTGVTGIKLSLSTDSGVTYPTVITANTGNNSYYYWTVPNVSTAQARIKMEVLGTTISDTSDANFTISGSALMDTTPPGPVTNLKSVVGDGKVVLSWTNPTADFSGAKVIRKAGSAPTGVTDGTSIYDGAGTGTEDTGLTNGTTYYYAVYAHDAAPNYAPAATVVATPQAGATTTEQPATTGAAAGLTATEAAAPVTDNTAVGIYNPDAAKDNTPSINVDKQLPPPPEDKPALCVSGSLIKLACPAGAGSDHACRSVYYCGRDGKRYGFPNAHVFNSWFADFSSVQTITSEVMASLQLGGNVNYRPGVRMVKIVSVPKVYAISRDGLLRWVSTEAVAIKLYGADWNKKIDDVPDSFFFTYRIGDPITEAEAASTAAATAAVTPPPAAPAACTTTVTFTEFLSRGSTNAQVLPLQNLLQCLGYFPAGVTPTGTYGLETENAVKSFQAAKGIDVFGYVGPGTRSALNGYTVH
ncbi:MAG: peptidoglycan-binding protein, partial [Patescibacteria group bacterium]|nr:peptidoglycan-binding protein [Patescibacteria group bacterium]